MTSAPTPDERGPADPASPDAAPPSEATPPSEEHAAIDWPDRSHWSEFDLAIEAGLGGASEPDLETDRSEAATQPRS